jgi:UDP-glucose:(heptosyl)LPS alpha-1,3-glucosyltransferase
MERTLAELIRRVHQDYRLVVISSELAPDLRPLVTWQRVPTPRRPFPLRFSSFFILAGLRLAVSRAGVIHTMGAIVPNRVEVAGVHFCHAGFRRATGSRAPTGLRPLRRLNTVTTHLLSVAAERWCYRPARVQVLATVSNGVKRELQASYPDVPVVITPNGVDTDRFRPAPEARQAMRAAEGIGDDEVVALFVGGDWDRKGLGICVEGLALAVRDGARLRLWVVGEGDEARIRELAERNGVGERVHLFGRQAAVERWYQAADIFVLPTAYEAFPLVGLEAAAAGLPLVVTAVNGFEDLVVDSDAGLLVERSCDAVGRALAALAADNDRRARMGATARQRALEYGWDRSVQAVRTLYDELANDRSVSC